MSGLGKTNACRVGILAGGLGTRLQEETAVRPKPMIEIGGLPLLVHIMRMYARYGFDEFAIALGYKGEQIKEYFLGYRERASSLTIDLRTGEAAVHEDGVVDAWSVHLLDTGLRTETGGRVKRLLQFAGGRMMLTYGDGVADVDVAALLAFHEQAGRLATVTAVRPPARFGSLTFDGDVVSAFVEKPQAAEGWINGGFFVLEPGVADYIDGDETLFEREPLERLAADGQLAGYRHHGFWHPMDTQRDVRLLEELWQSGAAPWRM